MCQINLSKRVSDTDYNKLVENYQTSANFRVRNRSHAILLSFQKYSIAEIAKICQVYRTAARAVDKLVERTRIRRFSWFAKKWSSTDFNFGRASKSGWNRVEKSEVSTSSVKRNQARNGERNQPIYAQKIGQKKDYILREFEEKIEEWAKQGLKIYFLPAYCPSLNKIEMLWEKIKYDWLSWEAYNSYKNLCQELDQVLAQIGSKYYITFAQALNLRQKSASQIPDWLNLR